MKFIIHQNISIHLFKVGSVSNSSVLQIGSAGSIHAHSELYNSSGAAEPPQPEETTVTEEIETPVVPLSPPS